METEADSMTAALQNDLILENIFRWSSVSDLKAIRRTCHRWRHFSLKSWKSSALTSLATEDAMSHFLHFFQNPDPLYPFVLNFRLQNGPFPHFWLECGPLLKILELRRVTFDSVSTLRRILFESCPLLVQLTLQSVLVSSESPENLKEPAEYQEPESIHRHLKSLRLYRIDPKLLGISYTELLGRYPALKAISVDGPIHNPIGLFHAIGLIRKKFPNNLPLEHLDIDGIKFIYQDIMTALLDPGLHLKSFSAKIHGIDDRAPRFQQICRAHASTLRKLSLTRTGTDRRRLSPQKCFSGDLPHLQELSLSGHLFDSWDFLQFTPNLTRLEVTAEEYFTMMETTNLEGLQGVTLPRLRDLCTHFDLFSEEVEANLENFRTLLAWTPNLERWDVGGLSPEQAPIFYQFWRDLAKTPPVTKFEVLDCLQVRGLAGGSFQACVGDGDEHLYRWKPVRVPFPRINVKCRRHNQRTCPMDYESRCGYCAVIWKDQ